MRSLLPLHKRPLLWYFILSFVISWGLIILFAGPSSFPIDPEGSADILPVLYVSMLFGPSLASLLLTWSLEGFKGVRHLFARSVRWRVGWAWYAVALLATPVLALIILGALSFFSEDIDLPAHLSAVQPGMLVIGLFTGAMVGFFEELGWTGFAVPRMLRLNSILKTGFWVGVIWGLWHFILFWEADSFSSGLAFCLLLGRLLAWLPPFRILMVWLFVKTGSMLIVILTHMSLVFTTTVLVPMDLAGVSLLGWLLVFAVALWILVIVFPAPAGQLKTTISGE